MTPIPPVFKLRVATGETELANDVAARCAAKFRKQSHPLASLMGIAELRGYVRARVFPTLLDELPASTTDRRELVAEALERTVQLVVRDLQLPPVVDIPAAHVAARAAA